MKKAFFLILLLSFPCIGFAQNEATYRILDAKPVGSMYVITYENLPIGDEPDAEYKVVLRITREKDKKFFFDPSELSGDIGVGKFRGSNLTIRWNYGKQFPKGLQFDDIEFELTVSKREGIPSWIWYGGGIAAVGAGAYFYIKSKKTEDSEIYLPDPPGERP